MLKAENLKEILEVEPGEPPKVRAVILYEDFTCGLRLKHAFDELFGEVFLRAAWAAHYRLSLWSFKTLRVKAISQAAAKELAHASLFCVASLGRQHLSPEVVFLVQQWLAHQDGQPSAMVLAGYGDDPTELRSSPVGAYLQVAAKRTGKVFLAHPLGQPRGDSPPSLEGTPTWSSSSPLPSGATSQNPAHCQEGAPNSG